MNSDLTVSARARLDDTLSIVELAAAQVPNKKTTFAVEHFLVIDVSGSMTGDLPKLRQDMKEILRNTGSDDKISVVWFSGRSQCGTLFEHEKIGNLSDFDRIGKAIDRWLQPVGLTGFKEPLELVSQLARSTKLPASLIFMSDGCDNQWSRSDLTILLKSIASTNPFQGVTVFEYGYYADRQLLGEIATTLGGNHVFAEDYRTYNVELQRILKDPKTSPRITYDLPVNTVSPFVFAIDSATRRISTYDAGGGAVTVPEDTEVMYAITDDAGKFCVEKSFDMATYYAAAKLYLERGESKMVWKLLGSLGDVRFVTRFATCFGKQAHSELAADLEIAAFNPRERMVDGYKADLIPRKDQITILDFFGILGDGDAVRVNFKYNRIGRKAEALEPDEMLKVAAARYAEDKSEESKAALIALVNRLHSKATFIPDSVDAYALDGLVMPEGRANLSFRIKQHGNVGFESVPAEYASRLPQMIRSFRYRNYAIIKDGLLNIDRLEFKLSAATQAKIAEWRTAGRWPDHCDHLNSEGFTWIDLGLLPLSNLMEAEPVEPQWLFAKEWDLLQAQAAVKVYKAQMKDEGDTTTSFSTVYGQDIADWLKALGLTEGGWNPPTQKSEAKDAYRAREVYTRIKGYSALPSINEVRKQMEKDKVGKPAALMVPHLKTAEDIIANSNGQAKAELALNLARWQTCARRHANELAKAKFGMIVNGTWLKGVAPDQTTFNFDLDGSGVVECIAEQKVIEVPI